MLEVALYRADEPLSDSVLQRVRIPMIRRCRLAWDGGVLETFVVDLGLTGIFVEHPSEIPVGTRVEMRFCLPGNDLPLSMVCRVAWWRAADAPGASRFLPAGVGLEFTDVSDTDRARVRECILDYMRRDAGTRRFVRHGVGEEGGS